MHSILYLILYQNYSEHAQFVLLLNLFQRQVKSRSTDGIYFVMKLVSGIKVAGIFLASTDPTLAKQINHLSSGMIAVIRINAI